MSLPFRQFSPIKTPPKICIIRTIALKENFRPTPKLTLTKTLTLTVGNFLRGQLSGWPPTLKLTLTLTQTPTLTGGNFRRWANCPDTISRPCDFWICRMGEILCFSARFFIYPNYTKEFENTYNKECLITKISSKIKVPLFRNFLLIKGASKLQRKRILTNTQNIQQKHGF